MNNSRFLLVYPNQMMQNLLPVGISLLSACLKRAGFQVEVFDTTLYKTEDCSGDDLRTKNLQFRESDIYDYVKIKKNLYIDDFSKLVNEYKPHIIGYTITDDTLPLAENMMKAVRGNGALTVAGGATPTFVPEKIIEHEDIDIICIGEGEEALVELGQAIESKTSFDNIRNLWIKTPAGTVIKNKMRPLVKLEELPDLDFSIWEDARFYRPMQGKVYRMMPVYTDRGCPYNCTYCCAPSYKKLVRENCGQNYLRIRDPDYVIDEVIRQIMKYDFQYIYFCSETFCIQKYDKLLHLMERFKKEVKLPFWFQSRPENAEKNLMKLLKDSGADRTSVGIECGNESYRNNILQRKYSNEEAIRAFDILSEVGLPVTSNNIIGFPGETRDMIFDTIALNRQLKVDTVSVFLFSPYHGTELRNYCISNGYLDAEAGPADRRKDSSLKQLQISMEELKGLQRTFPMYVKFEEKYFDLIRKAEAFDSEGEKTYFELSEIFKNKFLN